MAGSSHISAQVERRVDYRMADREASLSNIKKIILLYLALAVIILGILWGISQKSIGDFFKVKGYQIASGSAGAVFLVLLMVLGVKKLLYNLERKRSIERQHTLGSIAAPGIIPKEEVAHKVIHNPELMGVLITFFSHKDLIAWVGSSKAIMHQVTEEIGLPGSAIQMGIRSVPREERLPALFFIAWYAHALHKQVAPFIGRLAHIMTREWLAKQIVREEGMGNREMAHAITLSLQDGGNSLLYLPKERRVEEFVGIILICHAQSRQEPISEGHRAYVAIKVVGSEVQLAFQFHESEPFYVPWEESRIEIIENLLKKESVTIPEQPHLAITLAEPRHLRKK